MPALTATGLWSIPRVGAPEISGSTLVVPVTTHPETAEPGRTRLWRVPLDGSPATALTAASSSATKPGLDGTGTRLAFLRDVDGRRQVHVMPVDGGEASAVTDFPLGAIGFRWFPDGRRLVVIAEVYADAPTIAATAERRDELAKATTSARTTDSAVYRYWDRWLTDGRVPHLFVVDTEGDEPVDLTPDSTAWMRWDNTGDPTDDVAVSPDGAYVAACFDRSEHPHLELRWSLLEIPVDGGDIVEITPDVTGHVSGPRYTPDGRYLVFGATEQPRFYADRVRILRRDRADGTTVELTDGWDRSPSQWVVDGDGLLLVAEDEGSQPLWRMSLEGGVPDRLPGSGTFTAPGRAPDGAVVARRNGLRSPDEIVLVGDTVDPLTSFTSDALEGVDLPEVEEFRVDGARGDTVQGWLVRPAGVTSPAPLVHMIHGGPHGAFGDTWHWRWNAAVFCGDSRIAALVNFHGSTGFGQEFAECIRGTWGEFPAIDVEATTDHLVAAGVADPDRMAITGGSYGGYMVAWLVSQTDRYACAIAHAAVTALPGMYASDVVGGRAEAYGAEVWEDLDRINRYSPAAHAEGYSTPTLVIHGDRDYRVPVTQGLEFYGVLKAKGVEARLVHYPDENHWILSRGNSLHWYGEVTDWLDTRIG